MKGSIRVNKGHPGSEVLKWFKLGIIQAMDVHILSVYRCSVGGLVSRAGQFSYPRVPLRFTCSFWFLRNR